MRPGIVVAVLTMAVNGADGSVVAAEEPAPAAVAQQAGQWEGRTSITAFVANSNVFAVMSDKARLHLPLVTATMNKEETTETVIKACWSEATAAANAVPDPVVVLAALHREFADIPCIEPDHPATVAILQCDFGGGITAIRSLSVGSNTPTGFEIADEMMLKRGDTGPVVLHWRIATKVTWIGPDCEEP